MVYIVYKGVRFGLGAVAADFHDTAQIVHDSFTILRMISDLRNQFDYGAQQVKTFFVVLIESPYTTLCKTVCTGHDLSSDEISQTDPIKKDVRSFEQM